MQAALAEPPPDAPSEVDAGGVRRMTTFAPGIHIDWSTGTVAFEARVVLRRGPLELLACSPGTREHESILLVPARPIHMYQAMGLVGLDPGAPPRFDSERQQVVPASGQALEIVVRYRQDGVVQTVPAQWWLLDTGTRKPPATVPWVFAGSRFVDRGGLAAEVEGTLVCVVDFSSALIAMGSTHSADNASLWLEANTKVIPPVGTPCTLLVRAKVDGRMEVVIDAGGVMRVDGAAVAVKELAARLKASKTDRGRVGLVVRAGASESSDVVDWVIASLAVAGVDAAAIEVWPLEPPVWPAEPAAGRAAPRARPVEPESRSATPGTAPTDTEPPKVERSRSVDDNPG